MKGYQLTFFITQDCHHHPTPMSEWLLKFAQDNGAYGGTMVAGTEGFDRAGRIHSTHFFDLADQPLAVTVSVDEECCERLMSALSQEDVDLAYVKVPVEYGRVGKTIADDSSDTKL
jgi:PII-like signaling protein